MATRPKRRGRKWWAALTPEERSQLVQMERANCEQGDARNLPEGYSCCTWCSYPTSGLGLCSRCGRELEALLDKADRAIGLGRV